ncbi:MAG TPA: nucleoside 2-deoxyribosyltransferase [Nitrososphaerales archaeon]|nr:nucleoside 2-deoxyribosyltransferase [Nitrososphaerales archaeon]
MKVYLSVPIIFSRNAARAKMMARAIADSGHEVSSPWVLEPSEQTGTSPLDVFSRDSKGVEKSDAIVADVSAPSTGVGMEVMAAHILRKKVVIVMRRGSVVSRMIAHMEPKELIEFDEDEDLYLSLRRALEGWSRS